MILLGHLEQNINFAYPTTRASECISMTLKGHTSVTQFSYKSMEMACFVFFLISVTVLSKKGSIDPLCTGIVKKKKQNKAANSIHSIVHIKLKLYNMFSPNVSFLPELEKNGMKCVIWLWRVIPCQMFIDTLNSSLHLVDHVIRN